MTAVSEIRLLVSLIVDAGGKVCSGHEFLSEADAQIASQLSGGGIRHIAHGLLLEAFRREVYVDLITKMSHDKDFLQRYRLGDSTTRHQIECEIAQIARQIILDTTGKIGLGVTREILEMIVKQDPIATTT